MSKLCRGEFTQIVYTNFKFEKMKSDERFCEQRYTRYTNAVPV